MERQCNSDDVECALALDLAPIMLQRRNLLRLIAGSGLIALVGCSSDDSSSSSTDSSPADAAADAAADVSAGTSCEVTPPETGGPFPGDGTNGPNLLTEGGVVRQDIRTSIGSASGTAAGITLTVNLTLVDSDAGCVPLPGAAVHVWHATADGRYSMYSNGITDENYLRGVQESSDNGMLSFTTILPGCYQGRWPHIHFEVYADLASATNGGNAIATSQLAFPRETCEVVYGAAGYETSRSNLERVSLDSDNVFGDDGAVHQMATMSGDNAAGWVADLTVTV